MGSTRKASVGIRCLGPYAGIEKRGYRWAVRDTETELSLLRNETKRNETKRNEKRRIQPRSKPLIADHT